MDVDIKHRPSFSLAVARLAPDEEIRVEPGAMVSHSYGVTTDTKMEGGLFGGLKRMMGGESFFQNTFRAPAEGGEITVAPSLPGDLIELAVGPGPLLLRSGAFVASEAGVQFDTTWGGARGFFGGSLLLLKVTGSGTVIASSYGAIEERILAEGQRYVVDTGHVVGFDDSVQFEVSKSGGWKSAVLGGEGLVCTLTGPGRVLMQSRSEEAFLGWLVPKLPQPKG
ncbi:MAG: TIGR00266 family protein [Myxococcales bacterium]|nr:TIGR00266 family protein [Myxococcales bacterium]